MTDTPRAHPAALEQFCRIIAQPLELVGAGYQHGPMNGHEWRWSTDAGAWAVTVGGALEGGPRVTGPGVDNRWHMLETTLEHADLVILMLQLAGALPGRPTAMGLSARPAPARPAPARPVPPERVPFHGAQGMPVAGSDLPSRSGEYPATRSPRPYPSAEGRGPGAAYTPQPAGETRSAAQEHQGLMGRLYGSPGGRPAYPANDRGVNILGTPDLRPYSWAPGNTIRDYLDGVDGHRGQRRDPGEDDNLMGDENPMGGDAGPGPA